jgi:transcription elongation GreA/GreB family factor
LASDCASSPPRARSQQLAEILNDAQASCRPTRSRPTLVTMNARFVIRDLKLQRRQILAVCYPAHADASTGSISVLSPRAWA